MPYPSIIGGVSRFLTPEILIHSSEFTRGPVVKFGARMALIKLPNDNVVVWSALPLGPEATRCLEQISPYGAITHLIMPDKEHTMAAPKWVAKYPSIAAVGVEGITATPMLGGEFTLAVANKILKGKELAAVLTGNNAQDLVNNFEFVYLPGHINRELVMFHPRTKTLFEADLMFNIQRESEQYGGADPTTGWSYITRFLNPYSKVGSKFIGATLAKSDENKRGIAAIDSWDFERIVMCHGEIIEGSEASKSAFRAAFKEYLS